MLDPEALDFLADKAAENWVLVTADDAMPWEHHDHLAALGATVATLDGEWERVCAANGLELGHEHFKRETVHRWAHAMEVQPAGTVRRYSPIRNGKWTARKKFASRLST